MRTRFGLLTRHFLRQFLENDTISPGGDRAQLLAVVGAMAVSATLFLSMFMSRKYLGTWMPGSAAVASLDDKFFYLAFGMIVAALVAAAQWEALSIDPRDAAILEPLPVPAGTIRRAKLAAVAMLGATVAIAINLFPSFVFPWLLAVGVSQLGPWGLALLMVVHAVVSVAAAAFGYLVVVALRETAAAVAGPRGFSLVSSWLQGALIVVLGSSLLLLPAAADRVAQRGFDGWRSLSPPLWFLGVYETLAGGVIADLPRSATMTPRQQASDSINSALYDQRRDEFPTLARRAGTAAAVAFAFAAASYLWRARRQASLSPAPPARYRRPWRLGARLADLVLVRDSVARAGFYFALAAMWRSNIHRLTLACAAAAGFAMAILALSNAFPEEGGPFSARFLAVQPLLYGALLVGCRHVIRVPAELRANWGFQLAWSDRGPAFVRGVKCAALIALAVPALLVVLPLFIVVLGLERAVMQALLGLAGAIVLLELLLFDYDKVPFTCTYLPSENMKALAPLYLLAFLYGASWFARLQQAALTSGWAPGVLAVLAVMFVALRVIGARRSERPPVDFDEVPTTYQRLDLYT
ncbi:MAG: hypothetical protein Q8O42_16890 [Acidobacteriota bacterium]|nr:hypothetical protein [Acidobacteriota bacterium]